jgi:hypothetical protein
MGLLVMGGSAQSILGSNTEPPAQAPMSLTQEEPLTLLSQDSGPATSLAGVAYLRGQTTAAKCLSNGGDLPKFPCKPPSHIPSLVCRGDDTQWCS